MMRSYPSAGTAFCAAFAAVPILASASGSPWTGVVFASVVSLLVSAAGFLGEHRRTQWTGLISLMLVALILATEWPLRLSFIMAQGRLEHIAAAVRAGEKVQTPIHAGLFRVKKIDVRKWTWSTKGTRIAAGAPVTVPPSQWVVCLWTDPDAGQPSVVAQCSREEMQFNVQTRTQLSDRWQFVTED